jgi:phosphomannomutase
MTLKISFSGVRGIVDGSLTDEVVANFAAAFAQYLGGGTVVIGSDTRYSKDHIKDIVFQELAKNGCSPVDLGIAPTPTVQLATVNLNAKGGIVITASHNPSQWNGLKFIRNDGIFLNEEEIGKLVVIYENLSRIKREDDKWFAKSFVKNDSCADYHVQRVISNIDSSAIKKKKFRVALDSCNGAGSAITKELLKALDCEIIAINTDVGSDFPRGAEPVPENLGQLCGIVRDLGADVGFAQDPDADRLAVVSEQGVAIGEEYTLALCSYHILHDNWKIKDKTVVTNLSTSRMIDDIAKKFGTKVIRTKIGEVNVSETIKKENAIIGGEGNGGVIFPKVGYGRDSLSGIGLILDYLAGSGEKLSELAGLIPRYFIVKDKIALSDPDKIKSLLEKVKEKYKNEKTDMTDGIKIDFEDGWLHVRESNTEPAVRIIAEAKTKDKAKQMIEDLKSA